MNSESSIKKLACGHHVEACGEAMCSHLRTSDKWMECFKCYTGEGVKAELLCKACWQVRDGGGLVECELVCENCYDELDDTVIDQVGVRGKPEIKVRDLPVKSSIVKTELPEELGKVLDLSALSGSRTSEWILLTEKGDLVHFDCDIGDWKLVMSMEFQGEPDHKVWMEHELKPCLHVSSDGHFAAIVNDYGSKGRIFDLKTAELIHEFGGGSYHSNTVAYAFTFVKFEKEDFAVFRSDWNMLDILDLNNRKVLTGRVYEDSEEGKRPEHYLDYFHGALYVSPDGEFIVDDGWVWHPVGVVQGWSFRKWLQENIWESEDGDSKNYLCQRDYYWGNSICWINNATVAVEGIGDDDLDIMPGVRLFDVTRITGLNSNYPQAVEVRTFAGPEGRLFSDENWLYSATFEGLSRWDIKNETRIAFIKGFNPSYQHTGARELVQLTEGALLRWRYE